MEPLLEVLPLVEQPSAAPHLLPAQRDAAWSQERLVVVQGGPGTGKTETAIARATWLLVRQELTPRALLVLVPDRDRATALRQRFARELAKHRLSDEEVREAAASVVALPDLLEELSCVAMPDLVIAPQSADAPHDVVAEVAQRLVIDRLAGREPDEGAVGDSAMLRLGAVAVADLVLEAQTEVLRRLRALSDGPLGLAKLVRRLAKPADIGANASTLRAELRAASHAANEERPELECIGSLLDVACVDLADAIRREALAAPTRARIYQAARALADAATRRGQAIPRAALAGIVARRLADPGWLDSLGRSVTHVIADDAHEFSGDELALVRALGRSVSLFVLGDQRAAARAPGSRQGFCGLLADARGTVLLLEAPRLAPACGRFVNAVGARLWPASEPGGFAPAALCSPRFVAGAAVELFLVRRRVTLGPDGVQHPEPIAVARGREAMALAERAGALIAEDNAEVAILTLTPEGHAPIEAALGALKLDAGRPPVLTIDESRGREWETVVVGQLDDHYGAGSCEAPELDAETGLPLVEPMTDAGRRIRPLSTLLLAARAVREREDAARRRFFLALSRARDRLILSGVTRDRVAGLRAFTTPIEWLRHALGITDLAAAAPEYRIGDAAVRVCVVDRHPALTAST